MKTNGSSRVGGLWVPITNPVIIMFPMHEPPFLSEPDHATDEHLFQKKNIYKKDLDFFVGFWSK